MILANSAVEILQKQNLQEVRSVYVHVPFCQRRCGYCDFAIVAGRNDLVPRYLKALETELQRDLDLLSAPLELETLYLGGGTPTLLSPAELDHLLQLLKKYFIVTPQTEFTFEANPDQFTTEKQDLLASSGVNRISLGVQSFDSHYLHLLERTHSHQQSLQVIREIQKRFQNFSLDLIFALPEQTLTHWQATLQQAIACQPQHLSTYALTFEKGTRFWGEREKGKLHQVMETAEAEMYEASIGALQAAGYEQYEISNFARPGCHSRHNTVYWTGKPYLAYGPGASRFVGGIRQTNHRSTFTWLKRLETGISPVDLVDELAPPERAQELFAIGLRRNQGVSAAMIRERTGQEISLLLAQELQSLIARDWLKVEQDRYFLTSTGRLFADAIAAEVI